MKDLDYYMSLPYKAEVVPDISEGGFAVMIPELPGCISSGETLQDAYENSIDAKREWLTAALEDNIKIPEPKDLSEYSGQFKLRLPKSLHKSLVENSRKEGVSLNQYCVYLLSKGAFGSDAHFLDKDTAR